MQSSMDVTIVFTGDKPSATIIMQRGELDRLTRDWRGDRKRGSYACLIENMPAVIAIELDSVDSIVGVERSKP